MNKKTIGKLAGLSILAVIFLFAITPTREAMFSAAGWVAGAFDNLLVLALLVTIAIMGGIIFYMIWGPRIETFGKRAVISQLKGKIHSLMDCEEAAKRYLCDEFNLEDYSRAVSEGRLCVKARYIIDVTSDTPFCVFCISASQMRNNQKDKIHELPEHEKHFLFVSRRTLDVSYNPDIGSFDQAFKWLEMLLRHAMPMELKKKPLEKAMEQAMKERFVGQLGEDIAGKSKGTDGRSENDES